MGGHDAGGLALGRERQPLQIGDVLETFAIRQLAARIHRLRLPERIGKSVLAESLHRLTFFGRTVSVAPPAENVKILQSKSRRIDLGVTSRAGLNGAMSIQLLTNRGGSAR